MALKDKLGKEFVITTELGGTDGTDVETTIEKAKGYIYLDAFNIHDCPMARLRMNSVMLAAVIQNAIGIEAIPHYTCRDRSLLGTQADLLGAHALGIKNILPTTGDPPQHGPYESKAVYDLNTIRLIELIKKMNEGKDSIDKEFKGNTNFAISATATPTALNLNAELRRVESKINAGANFLQTQPIYDPEKGIAFMEKMKDYKIPVIMGIMPLKSLKMAEYMKNEVEGVDIPDEIINQLKDGVSGVDISCQIVEKIYPYVDGIHIMALGDVAGSNKIIEKALELKNK